MPWAHRQARLSELSIEQMFGQLRSVQSQMSVEAFCRLSAQRMLKEVENKFKSQKTRADHPKRAPKLSEQKFKAAAQSAYDAAIELVSWAANVETDSLRQYYEESVESLWFSEESTAEVIADHEEDEDETLPEEEVARSSCLGLMTMLYIEVFEDVLRCYVMIYYDMF